MSVVTVEREGELLIVTMNRPEKLNALNEESHNELERVWNEFFADPGLRVGILTGAGDKSFCVGSDLSMYAFDKPAKPLANGYAGLTHRASVTKPIIAAVNGLCLGGGLEVLTIFDLAVAAEHAKFGLPEPRVGAAALGGGIPRLCRKIPYNIAMGIILAGKQITAQEALHYGLINEVVPRGEALKAAKVLAHEVLKGAPRAIQASKQVADMTLRGENVFDVIKFEDGEPKDYVMGSEDLREGAQAFLEKRTPVWTGR